MAKISAYGAREVARYKGAGGAQLVVTADGQSRIRVLHKFASGETYHSLRSFTERSRQSYERSLEAALHLARGFAATRGYTKVAR